MSLFDYLLGKLPPSKACADAGREYSYKHIIFSLSYYLHTYNHTQLRNEAQYHEKNEYVSVKEVYKYHHYRGWRKAYVRFKTLVSSAHDLKLVCSRCRAVDRSEDQNIYRIFYHCSGLEYLELESGRIH